MVTFVVVVFIVGILFDIDGDDYSE